jgi:hypothetical protein
MELRRSLRTALRDRMVVEEAASDARRAARGFHERQAKAHKRETPHDVLHCFSSQDNYDKTVRSQVSTATFEEVVAMSNAHDDSLYKQTAVTSMNGLFRPFVANVAASFPSGVLPMTQPWSFTSLAGVPNQGTLNPFKAKNDIEVFAFGNSYNGLHAYRRMSGITTADNVRAIGLRAPLYLVGWGFDITGKAGSRARAPRGTRTTSSARTSGRPAPSTPSGTPSGACGRSTPSSSAP